MKITKLIHKNLKKNIPYISPSISKASTLFFKNVKSFNNANKDYGLEGTNIVEQLEDKIRIFEKCKFSSIYPSGLSSIINIYLALLKKKDIVLLPNNVYFPHERGAKWLSKKIGFRIIFYNPTWKIKKFKKKIKEKKIKITWVEFPGSINLKCPNIKVIKKFSKKKKSILIIDNTFASSLFYKPIKHGFDISIIALTKFFSGGNDILLGSISTNKKYLSDKILKSRKNLGIGVSSEDCYIVIRSVSTLKMRLKKHDKNSTKVFNWLKKKNHLFEKIFFPKKKKTFKKHIKISSGIISFIFKRKFKYKIYKFINGLKIFKIGYSWGGCVSLIMLYKNIRNYKGKTIIRIFTGLENYKDLIKDIKKSLKNSGIF